MTDRRAENLRRLHEDPDFAAARDARARERFTTENDRLQRLANIAKRGCEVPTELEAEWKALKDKMIPNREAARMLGITWLAGPEDEAETRWKIRTASRIADELIAYAEAQALAGAIDPDQAFEFVELGKRAKRVLEWNAEEDETDASA